MVRHSPVTGRYVTIDVDGLEYKVFYLHNGRGTPLVCQHTAGCHNHQWRGLLEDEEITQRLQCHRLRLARHGKSDPPLNVEWWKQEYRLTAKHYRKFHRRALRCAGTRRADFHGLLLRRQCRAPIGDAAARTVSGR